MSKKSISPEANGIIAVGQEATAQVAVTSKSPGAEPVVSEVEESFGPQVFKTQPAVVTIKYGLTLNLENYESARIDVGVQLPCYKEAVNETYAIGQTWVKERVTKEVEDIKALMKNKQQKGFKKDSNPF